MQMHKKHNVQSVVLGKDTFAVTVYPNVDYAFIVALIVILDEINDDKKDWKPLSMPRGCVFLVCWTTRFGVYALRSQK